MIYEEETWVMNRKIAERSGNNKDGNGEKTGNELQRTMRMESLMDVIKKKKEKGGDEI